jgi:hypothetical protein
MENIAPIRVVIRNSQSLLGSLRLTFTSAGDRISTPSTTSMYFFNEMVHASLFARSMLNFTVLASNRSPLLKVALSRKVNV